jgi:hypothetical protein
MYGPRLRRFVESSFAARPRSFLPPFFWIRVLPRLAPRYRGWAFQRSFPPTPFPSMTRGFCAMLGDSLCQNAARSFSPGFPLSHNFPFRISYGQSIPDTPSISTAVFGFHPSGPGACKPLAPSAYPALDHLPRVFADRSRVVAKGRPIRRHPSEVAARNAPKPE